MSATHSLRLSYFSSLFTKLKLCITIKKNVIQQRILKNNVEFTSFFLFDIKFKIQK